MAEMNSYDYHYHTTLGDIRREIAAGDAQIRADVNQGFERTNTDIQKAAWHVSDKVSTEADRLTAQATANFTSTQDRFFALQKEVLDSKAALLADGAATRELINRTTVEDLRMQVLDARNQAERCIPRCSTSNGPGNSGK